MSIRVLIVDDSAFARKVLREVLVGARDIEVVGTARDGLDALEQIATLRPDVVTLDLVMPGLDGLGVLQALSEPRPAVVVVSISDGDSELGVRALQAGAVELVHKPTALATNRLYELRNELVDKVRTAARATLREPRSVRPVHHIEPSGAHDLVVVGASTGGPPALTRFVQDLPADLPVPVVIALHIPAGYTEALASRLDRSSRVHVVEARTGLVVEGGLVVIAAGGSHLRLHGSKGAIRASVDVEPLDAPHRPSVDLLFESAASLVGVRTLGVVLTGMGHDGTIGAAAIRRAGGHVLTESAASAVIYGMPRSVAEAGLSDEEAPIERMAEAVVARL